MEDTAYILTYRENADGERRDNLLAVLRWLELRPLLEVIVFEQDSVPRLELASASVSRRMLQISAARYDEPSVRLARDSRVTNSRASWGATQCSRFVSQIVPTELCRSSVEPAPAISPHRRSDRRRIAARPQWRWEFVPRRPAETRAESRTRQNSSCLPAACSSSGVNRTCGWVDSTSAFAAGAARTMR